MASAAEGTKSPRQAAIYTFSDGMAERVTVVKAHADCDGGGTTVYIPSLGRERQTVNERLQLLPTLAWWKLAGASLPRPDAGWRTAIGDLVSGELKIYGLVSRPQLVARILRLLAGGTPAGDAPSRDREARP